MRTALFATLLALGLAGCSEMPIDGLSRSGWSEPANMPPMGFDGDTWVDKRGCVYFAAGHPGARTWVPYVGGNLRQVCKG